MSLSQPYIPSPYIHLSVKRRKNTWYTIASGNWTDPNIWMSNGMSFCPTNFNYPGQAVPSPIFPAVGDDVCIGFGHTVTFDISSNSTTTINNLYVTGTFANNAGTGKSLNVMGDLQVTGTVDLSLGGISVNLFGVNNLVANFLSGSGSTIVYARINSDQYVMDLPYYGLTVQGGGTKNFTSSLTVLGNTNVGASTVMELGIYNATFNGLLSNSGTISKTGSGNILCKAAFNTSNNAVISFTGNPSVELRAGLTFAANGGTFGATNLGSGTWSFTTISQTATFNGTYTYNGSISVVGEIDLIVAGAGAVNLNQAIDHTVAGRTTTNKGTINFNSTASVSSFVVGTFDRTSFANTVGYTLNSSITLPYTTYYSLTIAGTGVKTQAANLTLPGSLTISAGGNFQSGAFDITVAGATSNSGTFGKSSAGSIVLIGATTFSSNSVVDFTGSPSVELRGGLTVGVGITFNGSVTLTFTTNNQTITTTSVGLTIPYNILISGPITVATSASTSTLALTGVLNGNNAASTFDNRNIATSGLQYQNAQQPMLTGILQTNAAANTFIYNKAGDQDIKGGAYRTLQLAGSGVKTLQGNVTTTSYTLTPPATLNLNGFTRN